METTTEIKNNEKEYMKEIDFLGVLQFQYWINKKLCRDNPNKDYVFLDEGLGKGEFVKLIKEGEKIMVKTFDIKGYGDLEGNLIEVKTVKQGYPLSVSVYRNFDKTKDSKKQQIYYDALKKSKFYNGVKN
ncbi:MAG: hypothetical protein ABIE36_00225 [Candidatus Diapherotrites archaeon]